MQWWCSAQGIPWTWTWRPYPGVWAFVFVVAVGYALLLRTAAAPVSESSGTMRATSFPMSESSARMQVASFAAGLLALWIALDWPVGALGGGYLASVHMVQFLVIALVAPPLLLYGVPERCFRPLRDRSGLSAALRGMTRPPVALILFNIAVITTHAPWVVDRLMSSQLGSFAIDMAWLGSGLLFWWPVVAPVPQRPGFRDMVKVGYLALQSLATTPLFVWLTFSEFPVYATFELAPRVESLSARVDQQTAGLLMKIGGMLIMLTAVGILFLRWSAREDQDARVAASARPGERVDRFTAAGP